jgi:enamine deaminase RidA (YjgF/YER057c/UK114 family)
MLHKRLRPFNTKDTKKVFPCSTGLVVPALARPEWVVEIEVTVVIPEEA